MLRTRRMAIFIIINLHYLHFCCYSMVKWLLSSSLSGLGRIPKLIALWYWSVRSDSTYLVWQRRLLRREERRSVPWGWLKVVGWGISADMPILASTDFFVNRLILANCLGRGWVDPRALVRLEGLRELKKLMPSSGIEPATLRLVS
jgi:hypothetical protein